MLPTEHSSNRKFSVLFLFFWLLVATKSANFRSLGSISEIGQRPRWFFSLTKTKGSTEILNYAPNSRPKLIRKFRSSTWIHVNINTFYTLSSCFHVVHFGFEELNHSENHRTISKSAKTKDRYKSFEVHDFSAQIQWHVCTGYETAVTCRFSTSFILH